MVEDAEIWQALLRAKGLTVAQLADDLHTTRQHAHRLLTGKRSADARRHELDRALALGPRRGEGRPLYALAILSRDRELELLPAGDTQPLYDDREQATGVAERLDEGDRGVCVVPVWPEYAWRRTVAFHAAWGSTAEPRNVFVVDEALSDVPVATVIDELHHGYAETLRLRAAAEDPEHLQVIEALVPPSFARDNWEPDVRDPEPGPGTEERGPATDTDDREPTADAREPAATDAEADEDEGEHTRLVERIDAWLGPGQAEERSAWPADEAPGAERLH